MQIVVGRRESIKPSSTTPHHLRNLKLSLLDQLLVPAPNLRLLLFYSAQGDPRRFQNTNTGFLLKKSLSRTLTDFYPLAGRLSSDQKSIACNDSGVEYTEARVQAPFMLDQLLDSTNADQLYLLYPPAVTAAAAGGYLCSVQVTLFEGCGGMVVGVCLSHTIGDKSALSMFVDSWAAITKGDTIVAPKFGFADVFPPVDDLAAMLPGSENHGIISKPEQKLVTERFVLNKSEIASLMANADQFATKVQVTCALISKCLINIWLRSVPSKPIFLDIPTSWRHKMTPPVPPNSVGNLALSSISEEITELESFPSLVGRVSRTIRKADSDYLKKILADDASLLFSKLEQDLQLCLCCMDDKVHILSIGSFCGIPFYEADFGWGRPIWAAAFYADVENFVALLDAKNGDGVEAWITLNNDDMTQFGSEYELFLRDLGASKLRPKI